MLSCVLLPKTFKYYDFQTFKAHKCTANMYLKYLKFQCIFTKNHPKTSSREVA